MLILGSNKLFFVNSFIYRFKIKILNFIFKFINFSFILERLNLLLILDNADISIFNFFDII